MSEEGKIKRRSRTYCNLHAPSKYVPEENPKTFNFSQYASTSYDSNLQFERSPDPIVNPLVRPATITRDMGLQPPFGQVNNKSSKKTDDFQRFALDGCKKAEKIIYDNRHKSCYENMYNSCVNTEMVLLESNNTPSNVEKNGIPWVTKDFIYIFVRLSECWKILSHYLDAPRGTYPEIIESKFTEEFRNCFVNWTKSNRALSESLVEKFYDLNLKTTVNAEKLKRKEEKEHHNSLHFPPEKIDFFDSARNLQHQLNTNKLCDQQDVASDDLKLPSSFNDHEKWSNFYMTFKVRFVLEELEGTPFSKILSSEQSANFPDGIREAYKKCNSKRYNLSTSPPSQVAQIKWIIKECKKYFVKNLYVMKQIEDYSTTLDNLLETYLAEFDFN